MQEKTNSGSEPNETFQAPNLLRRCWGRFRKQGVTEILNIISQEILFSRMRRNHQTISEINFFKLLLANGAVQERDKINTQSPIAIDPDDIKRTSQQYEDEIQYTANDNSRNVRIIDKKYTSVEYKKVTVKDLIILFGDPSAGTNIVPAKRFNLHRYIDQIFGITDITFENCMFIHLNQEDVIYPDGALTWHIEKSEDSVLEFTNCFFRGIWAYITVKTVIGSADKDRTIILKDNVFLSSPSLDISVSLDTDLGLYSKIQFGQGVKKDASLRTTVLDNCYLYWANITVASLSLKGRNKIENLTLTFPTKKYMVAEDQVQEIELSQITVSGKSEPLSPNIDWGPYQKIKPYEDNWLKHKEQLIYLRDISQKRKDELQVSILNRELVICDHELIRLESKVASFQDRITLWFNKWVSNYGISWLRPTGLLFLMNSIFTLIAVPIISGEYTMANLFYVFAQTFNPLSVFVEFSELGKIIPSCQAIVGGLHVIQKALLAALVYEIIRAGRRFTRVSKN